MTTTASAPDRLRTVAERLGLVARSTVFRRAIASTAGALARAVARRLPAARADERGDVPGWVLISIMTAGIVMVLWATAGELLVQVFKDAIDRVSAFQ